MNRLCPANPSRLLLIAGLAAVITAGCDQSPESLLPMNAASSGSNSSSHPDEELSKPAPSRTGPYPSVVADEVNYDFGRMLVGTENEHEFTITNEGEAELELLAGKATCKCTQFDLSATRVSPGGSATLFVKWHGKTKDPSFNHGGRIYTNDPERPEIRFNVHGIVDSPVALNPARVWQAGNIVGDNPVTFDGYLYSQVLPELTIQQVTADSELTEIQHVPMTERELERNEARCGWKFTVSVQPGPSTGIQKDTLTVKIAELDDEVQIPVQGLRLGSIRYSAMRGTRFSPGTQTLQLGRFPASRGRKAELLLVVDQNDFEDELQLTEIETNPRSLRATLEPVGKATGVVRRYRLAVEVVAGGLRVQREKGDPGVVRCHTNHPTEKEIVLNVLYTSF